MNKQEFASVAMALQTYYPRFNLLPNDHALDLWFEQLADIDANVMQAAVKKWAAKEKWPPTIADLRELCCSTPYELALETRRCERLLIQTEERQRLSDKNMPETVKHMLTSISDILNAKLEAKEDAKK